MSPDQPSTRAVVSDILLAATRAVVETKAAALADEPDGVHQHRTSVRRLRSILGAFAPLLDETAERRVRVAYAWWGSQLGVVRDTEVRAAVAAEALRSREIDDRDMWRRLVEDEEAEYAHVHARLVELEASPRAREAERMLVEFARRPVVGYGDDGARRLAKLVRRELRRVRKAAARNDGSADGLHTVRKAARRLRYVAEAIDRVAPELFGADLTALAEGGETVHDILGDHRDLILLASRLEHTRAVAARAGESTAQYTVLVMDAEAAASRRLDELEGALRRLLD